MTLIPSLHSSYFESFKRNWKADYSYLYIMGLLPMSSKITAIIAGSVNEIGSKVDIQH